MASMNGRKSIRQFFAVLLSVTFCLMISDSANGQGLDVRKLQAAVKKAETMMKTGKQKSVADAVPKFQEEFERLAGTNPNVAKNLKSAHEDFKKIYASLELEGFELPAWKELPGPGEGGTEFTKDVAPILITKCGRCHIEKSSGRINFKSYADMMKAQDGLLVFPGKPDDSLMLDVIKSGDMPKGGLKITEEELATLTKWIAGGAKYDADNENDLLTALAPDADSGTAPMAEIKKATGKETVSFATDIAPVLIANCNGCHYQAQNLRGGLNMNNFQLLARGGDGGAIFVAGNPAESNLIKRLKSTGNDRMPQGRDPLDPAVIAKIEKWISEGATLDSNDPQENLQTVYATARATRSTHEELAQERVESSQTNWRLGMPGIESNQAETKNFLVIGNASPEELKKIATDAEKTVSRIARTFKLSTKDPLVKGRITLYVFKKRYDYSEFGKMVEQRTLPREWRGHWRYDIINAYGAVLPASAQDGEEGGYDTEALIGQQVAGVVAASLGKEVPRWFAEGAARATAARLEKRDPRVVAWNEALPQVMSRIDKPDDFITGKLSTEDADIVSYKFVDSLMSDSRKYGQLLNGLKSDYTFDRAFQVVYGGTPSQVATAWMSRGGK